MSRALAAVAVALAVGACSDRKPAEAPESIPDLENAAIARGLVIDPASVSLTGVYARADDRVCILAAPTRARIGVVVDFGEDQRCSGTGTVEQSGAKLRVRLSDECAFDARFDGSRIAFPGALPDGCASLCRSRASFRGLQVERLSESAAEAAAVRDGNGRTLCGTRR